MARWRLTNKHYLAVPGTEWEYKENNRTTGKQARKVFEVPLYLNPEDSADHNYRAEEAIIVAYSNKEFPRDIVFVGPPTPDMEPLDDEAREISERESKYWIHPIESLSGDYSASILRDFERQLAELQVGLAAKPAASISASVDPVAFAALQDQVKALTQRNAELETNVEKRRA